LVPEAQCTDVAWHGAGAAQIGEGRQANMGLLACIELVRLLRLVILVILATFVISVILICGSWVR
jgi:hypothetical protein